MADSPLIFAHVSQPCPAAHGTAHAYVNANGQPIPEPQSICKPISSSAIGIVATLVPGRERASQVRAWCGRIRHLLHRLCALARPLEQMLENMFAGRPAGNHDRLLDFSTAVTGGLFFAPSSDLLEELADRQP